MGRMISLLIVLLFTASPLLAVDGGLISRGGGEGANQHRLPTTAIDTTTLPRTQLSANDDATMTLPLYRLAEDTWFLYGNIATVNNNNRGFNGNAGFVVTSDGVVVIDTLGSPRLGERFITTIRSVTEQPIRYVIITHNHPDHAYGTGAFAKLDDVTIIGHRGMVSYIGSPTFDASVQYRRNLIPDDMTGTIAVVPERFPPDERFASMTLNVGDQAFDIYNVGGPHSHGDLVVHQRKQNFVWLSDLVSNQRLTFIGDGNSEQTLEAIDWVNETFADAALMIPGHGSVQTPPFSMIKQSRDYIQMMRDQIQEKIENGDSITNAMNEITMPGWSDLPLYEENQRRNVEFIYREMEFEFF